MEITFPIGAASLLCVFRNFMAPQVLPSIRILFLESGTNTSLAFYEATFGLANICGQPLGGFLVSLFSELICPH
jgi:predicted MFS family arabinose efflux permease